MPHPPGADGKPHPSRQSQPARPSHRGDRKRKTPACKRQRASALAWMTPSNDRATSKQPGCSGRATAGSATPRQQDELEDLFTPDAQAFADNNASRAPRRPGRPQPGRVPCAPHHAHGRNPNRACMRGKERRLTRFELAFGVGLPPDPGDRATQAGKGMERTPGSGVLRQNAGHAGRACWGVLCLVRGSLAGVAGHIRCLPRGW